MWCCQCQQDVPAARSASGPPACPRCHTRLKQPAHGAAAVAQPTDSGIALEAFDRAAQPATTASELLAPDRAAADLRRLGRVLRLATRVDRRHGESSTSAHTTASPGHATEQSLPAGVEIKLRATTSVPATNETDRSHQTAWGISLLLGLGGTAFAAGVALLASSAALAHADLWQAGLAATVTGEGMLILGLAAMAARLWHNSRRLNRQLDGVDRQLDEIHSATGQLAHSRLAASGAYYEHFGAASSVPLHLAHLRGQIDHLAIRLAAR